MRFSVIVFIKEDRVYGKKKISYSFGVCGVIGGGCRGGKVFGLLKRILYENI